MGLSDPFSTVYEGRLKAQQGLADSIGGVGGAVAGKMNEKNKRDRSLQMLKQMGLITEEEPDVTAYEKTLSDNAKKIGIDNLQIEGSADPEQRKNQIKTLIERFGLEGPKPKATKLNLEAMSKSGAKWNASTGDLEFDTPAPISQGMAGTKSVNFIDPITGEMKQVGEVDRRAQVFKGALTPEQMKERAVAEGEADFTKKNMEQSGKLGTAVKRLALLNKQYAKALPSGDRTPLEQRIVGGAESWAAKKGLVDNPELVALQKNIRPMAINLIRAFGEVGNLSESEQKGAIDTVDLPGLTDQERIAQTKQFIEFALAGANPEGIKMLTGQKDMQGILDAFGVDLSQFTGGDRSNIEQSKPKLTPEQARQELERRRRAK